MDVAQDPWSPWQRRLSVEGVTDGRRGVYEKRRWRRFLQYYDTRSRHRSRSQATLICWLTLLRLYLLALSDCALYNDAHHVRYRQVKRRKTVSRFKWSPPIIVSFFVLLECAIPLLPISCDRPVTWCFMFLLCLVGYFGGEILHIVIYSKLLIWFLLK